MRKATISGYLILLQIGFYGLADAQDRAAIQAKLVAQYPLTQATADNTDIVTAGAILVLKKGNLMMVPVSDSDVYSNTYKQGKITQNAIGRITRFRIPGASPAASNIRTFVAGEKMWVTKIEVKEDNVVFTLFTDAFGDVRYHAGLKFPIKGVAADQVEAMVAEVFKVQPAESQEPSQPAAPAAPPAGRTEQPPPPIAPPPPPTEQAPPPLAPPPPPTDEPQAAPKTLTLGETKDKVEADFGKPQRIAKGAGTKEIYFYKDIKVTFVGGKVTDIQ